MDIAEKNGVSGLWHLAIALELMGLEPILLEAPLTAVLDGLSLALGTCVKRNVLLLNFLECVVLALQLLLDDVLEGTHFVLAVGDVD